MDDRKERGTKATNRDYIRYEQVEKPQSYQLAEAGHAEAFDEEFRVRTLDVARFLSGDASDRSAFARELVAALREIGFAIAVVNGRVEHHRSARREAHIAAP